MAGNIKLQNPSTSRGDIYTKSSVIDKTWTLNADFNDTGTSFSSGMLNPATNDELKLKPDGNNSPLVGWPYRKPIIVDNSSNANALTNYQVLITLDTASLISAGKMRSDGGDIRFTDSDGTTLIDYWVESGINTANTKIWVKVPSIPASSTKTIYVYYGNPSASSASNIDNTMDTGLRAFYYDGTNFNTYEGTCVDTNAPNYNWGTGVVAITGCPNDQSDTVSIRWEGWVINRGSGTHTFYVTTDDGSRLYVPNTNLIINTWVDQGPTEYSGTYSFSSPVTVKYEWYENEGGAVAQLGWAPADGSGKVYPIPSTYVRNRKYTSPEPTTSVGTEVTYYASGEQTWTSETQDTGAGNTYKPNRLTVSWALDGSDNIAPKIQVLGSSTGAFAGEETVYPAGSGTYWQDGGTYDIDNGVEKDISSQVTTAYRYWKVKVYINTGTTLTDTPKVYDIRLRDYSPLTLQTYGGNVGIGTTAPGQKLEIAGKIKIGDDVITPTAGTIRWSGTNFEGFDGSVWKTLDVQATSGGGWTENAGTNTVYLTNSGRNVGIGTTAPQGKLHVTGGILRLDNNDIIFQNNDTGDIIFRNADGTQKARIFAGPLAGSNVLYLSSADNLPDIAIDSSGNVGIGTTAPQAKLHVIGTVTAQPGTYGDVVLTVPTGRNGIIIKSNDTNTYRADIRRDTNYLQLTADATTG
ncbi:MAG: DUF2341 domain-containing protein, partial [Caldisericum exile]